MNSSVNTLKSGKYILNGTTLCSVEAFQGELSITIFGSYTTKIIRAVKQESSWKITYMFLKNMREAILTKAPT